MATLALGARWKFTSAQSVTPPNIILIVTDDQRWDTTQYMPKLLARIGASGTNFTNAFVTTSLCCPSRSSILTGQYAHNHGVHTNQAPDGGFSIFNDTSTLATWLHDAGYKTGLIGKYLNGYNPDLLAPYIPPGWDTFQAIAGDSGYYNYTLTEYIDNVNNGTKKYGSNSADYITSNLSKKTKDFLNLTETNDAKPFFLVVATYAPHVPYTPPPNHKTEFANIPPHRPPSFNEADVSDKPSWVSSKPLITLTQISKIDTNRKKALRTLLGVDDLVGNIMNVLQTNGEDGNTVIIYMGDNGFEWGEHRIQNGKTTAYAEGIRVPLLVRDGRNPVQQSSPAITLNIDLTPTILELAGLPIPPSVDGRSLTGFLTGSSPPWRSDFLVENWSSPAGKYMGIRDNQWLYVEYATGEKELYDLQSDPYELQNLVNDPTFASQVIAMQTRLQTLKTCSGTSCP